MTQRFRTQIAGAAALAVLTLPLAESASADAEPDTKPISIEGILKSGWDVAGYASAGDNRSAFILFKKSGETYLIQCRAGYDVMREPQIFELCYRLR